MEGWISLHRKILNNPIIWKDSDHVAVWNYLLLSVTHREYDTVFQGKRYTLKPGQQIFGRKAMSEFLKINESKIQRILKTFEQEKQIEQQTSNKNRLITIVNWHEYQGSEQQVFPVSTSNQYIQVGKNSKSEQQNEQQNNQNNHWEQKEMEFSKMESEQQSEQQLNNKRTTTEQQLNTNNNTNNINNTNNNIKDLISGYLENKSEEFKEAFNAFLEMKKNFKNPIKSEYQFKLHTNNLQRLSEDEKEQIQIMNRTVMNGWKSFYPLKGTQKRQETPPQEPDEMTLRIRGDII